MDGWKHVGTAFTRPCVVTGRRDEFAIYRVDEAYGIPLNPAPLYVQYKGYRQEGWMVGLPLGGPGAAHTWPPHEFVPGGFEEVVVFNPPRRFLIGGSEDVCPLLRA